MELLRAVATGLAPPLCAACGRSCRPEAIVCTRCARRLAAAEPLLGKGPPGLDRAWSSAPHEGVARNLVAALKFRRLLPVADLMAERMHWLAPAHMLSGAVVPVPTAPARVARSRFRSGGRAGRGACRAAGGAARALPAAARRPASGRAAAGGAARTSADRPRHWPGAAQRSPRRRRPHHRCDDQRLRPSAAGRRGGPRRRRHLRPASVARRSGRLGMQLGRSAAHLVDQFPRAATLTTQVAMLLDLAPYVLGQFPHRMGHLGRGLASPQRHSLQVEGRLRDLAVAIEGLRSSESTTSSVARGETCRPRRWNRFRTISRSSFVISTFRPRISIRMSASL